MPFWPVLFIGLSLLTVLFTVIWVWSLALTAVLFACQFIYWKRVAEHFRYGDCNPGIVVKESPLWIATATNMATASDEYYPALKITEHVVRNSNVRKFKQGDFVPTVSLYRRNQAETKKRWDDFDPLPVFYATDDTYILAFADSNVAPESLLLTKTLLSQSDATKCGLSWFDPETHKLIRHPISAA